MPSGATLSGTTLTWRIPTLQPGESATLTYTVTVDDDAYDVEFGNVATPGDGGECIVCTTTHITPPEPGSPDEPNLPNTGGTSLVPWVSGSGSSWPAGWRCTRRGVGGWRRRLSGSIPELARALAGSGGGVPLRRARSRLERLLLAVLRRGGGAQVVEQVLRGVRDLVHGLVERLLVRLRRLGGPGDLADVLQRGSCTSRLVAGGSKLWSWRMLRHMPRG